VFPDKLINYTKTIDFDIVSTNYDFDESITDTISEFCSGLPNNDELNGAYRELEEFVLKLAEMFIVIDQALRSKSFLNDSLNYKYHFRFAIGADGAPFGKDDEVTACFI